jgi:hypothetical protein
MHEIGLYLPVHFGCKRILTLGFDLEPGVGKHFYSDKTYNMEVDNAQVPAHSAPDVTAWLRSLGVEWYRIATACGSRLAVPTIALEAV